VEQIFLERTWRLRRTPYMKKPKKEWRRTTIVVMGHGTFPYDMLRYDSCVPARGEDCCAMVDDNGPGRARMDDREVRLHRYSAEGTEATKDRWNSFGWGVIADTAKGDTV
jgi:hypothetical protein